MYLIYGFFIILLNRYISCKNIALHDFFIPYPYDQLMRVLFCFAM